MSTEPIAVQLVRRMTPWQYVIHGRTEHVRLAAVRHELAAGDNDRALAIALCGQGDVAIREVSTGEMRIRPRGCGHRLCPRCSRKEGGKFVNRVTEHLANFAHGTLYHGVYTQLVMAYEPLVESKKRFEKCWNRYLMWAKKQGLTNALMVIHVTRSRFNGWHYHGHLLFEAAKPINVDSFQARWQYIVNQSQGRDDTMLPFIRKVADAGEAMESMDLGDGDLFTESDNEIVKCLQYMVRDVCQGTENWVGPGQTQAIYSELIDALSHGRTRRLVGEWRHEVSERAEKENRDASELKVSAGPSGTFTELFRLDELPGLCRQHVSFAIDFVANLERTCRNRTGFGKRLIEFCRRSRALG